MKAHGGVEIWLYFSFKLDARWGWVVNATPRPHYPGKEARYLTYRLAKEPVCTGAVDLAPTEIRSPDRLPVASSYTDYNNIKYTPSTQL